MTKWNLSALDIYHYQINFFKIKIIFLKTLFFTLNLTISFLSSAITILAALITAKIIPTHDLPFGYLYLSSGVSATIILLTSILNFFLIKDKLVKTKKQIVEIEGEKIKYDLELSKLYQKPNKDYYFHLKISAISGNQAAKEAVQYA